MQNGNPQQISELRNNGDIGNSAKILETQDEQITHTSNNALGHKRGADIIRYADKQNTHTLIAGKKSKIVETRDNSKLNVFLKNEASANNFTNGVFTTNEVKSLLRRRK